MESILNETTAGGARSLRVAIVGGGFSGTLVAVHLLRQSNSVQIDIVEPRLPGRGLAYSTYYDQHLLNVPAIRMSAFGSEPLHFLHWLHAHGIPSAVPEMFAPRRLFGAYIQDVLETTTRSAAPSCKIRHHLTEAKNISFDGLSAKVSLANGNRLEADRVILASGNANPHAVVEKAAGYFPSPWQPGALANLSSEANVLLVGSGLTAVDAFLALNSQGHSGTIYMVSRRGKLPQPHTPYRPLPESFPVQDHVNARGLLRTIRTEVRKAETHGVDWRAVIDSLRPVTNEIWQKLELKEQHRVFRHLKTWWDIHRHRMAPEIGAKVSDALTRRQLIVHAGRLQKLKRSESGLQADILLRTGLKTSLDCERVINCTGPDSDYRSSESAAIQRLLDKGYVTPGSTGRGLRTTVDGELISSNGSRQDWLLTLGPPKFGDLFETTAVPELRKQAEALANRLLSISREPIEVMPEVFIAAGI